MASKKTFNFARLQTSIILLLLIPCFTAFAQAPAAETGAKPLFVYIRGPHLPIAMDSGLGYGFTTLNQDKRVFDFAQNSESKLAELRDALSEAKNLQRPVFILVGSHGRKTDEGRFEINLGNWFPIESVIDPKAQPFHLMLISCFSGSCVDQRVYSDGKTHITAAAPPDKPIYSFSILSAMDLLFKMLGEAKTKSDLERVSRAYYIHAYEDVRISVGGERFSSEQAYNELQLKPPSSAELKEISEKFLGMLAAGDLTKHLSLIESESELVKKIPFSKTLGTSDTPWNDVRRVLPSYNDKLVRAIAIELKSMRVHARSNSCSAIFQREP